MPGMLTPLLPVSSSSESEEVDEPFVVDVWSMVMFILYGG